MLDIEYLINRARHESAHLLIIETGFSPVVREGETAVALPYPELDGLDTFCLARDLSHRAYQQLKANEEASGEAFGCRFLCKPMDSGNASNLLPDQRAIKGVHIEVVINDLALSH